MASAARSGGPSVLHYRLHAVTARVQPLSGAIPIEEPYHPVWLTVILAGPPSAGKER